mmetsp:Transcript_20032/g.31913  ORF Transcript_20032/g.31913 Transcript_20032/m.31913 type:complete len:381 (-) Transcript_20032:532-1674(-)
MAMIEDSKQSNDTVETPDIDSMSTLELLLLLDEIDEDTLLADQGYKEVRKIRDTAQGDVMECLVIDDEKLAHHRTRHVIIKRTKKALHKSGTSPDPDCDMHFFVDHNILSEAHVLQQITSADSIYGAYIAKYIDFFESKDAYFLVTEYVAGDMTLDVFVRTAFDLIKQKKLAWRDYYLAAKFIAWQMTTVMHWLHTSMNIAHLDLSPHNIMLVDAGFECDATSNRYHISRNIRVKIVGFSVAEQFKVVSGSDDDARIVKKFCLRNSYSHVAPEVYHEQEYEAMKADVWSLGTILFQLLSGQRLCVTPDASDNIEGVLKSLANGCLAQWLAANKLGCFLRAKDLTAIENMLALNAEDRWSTSQVINCGFFAPYFRRYMITM